MKTRHLSESAIQQYALNKTGCETTIVNHIRACERCRTKADTYQLLFHGLQNQPKPAFDFNLSALVVARIEQPKSQFSWLAFFIYLTAFAEVIAISMVGYLHRKYIWQLFSGLSTMGMYLIGVTALLIVIFQSLEMYKKYKKQMNQLNFQ
jgi:hypothetical protein